MNTNSPPSRIRILMVEDSLVAREFLTHIFRTAPDLEVVGVAENGEEAVALIKECRPDVVTMDIHMPKMDGFEATRRIMETRATPIVILSNTSTVNDSATACRALGAGALAVEVKPVGPGHPDYDRGVARLLETVRTMAGVKVIQRRPARPGQLEPRGGSGFPWTKSAEIRIAAIGASTGGPAVLATILLALPKNLPFPVVIVQHICDGFTVGLGEWLAQVSGLDVRVAAAGELLKAGSVYLAPSGVHLGVSGEGRVVLSATPPENGVRPAVSHLFRSVGAAFGHQAVAVLLTGMGKDGAAELDRIRQHGGITVAQDAASSVVHGMPGEAIRLGAAAHVLSPEFIGALLCKLGGR